MTSGQTAQRKDGSWHTFAEQVQQAVDNLARALDAGGASARDVVKLVFYPVDWSMDLAEDLVGPILRLLSEKHGAPHQPLTTLVPVPKLAYPEAKFEIEAVALVGGTSEPWRDSKSEGYSAPPAEVDVVVVGGGFSGMAAASRCHDAGLSTVVLEAKSRIGGRSRSHHLDSGSGVVEMGATWINKTTQPEVYALTRRFGLETAEQYTEGDEVFQGVDGKVGPTEKDREQEQILASALIERPEALNIRKWHDFPAEEDVTFAEWVTEIWCTGDHAQHVANHLCSAIVGRGSDVVGAHYFLDYVKSGLGFISLITEGEMGAQSLKVKKGMSEIAYALGRSLKPGSIWLNSPVDSIVQRHGCCHVTTTAGASFKARKVIMANPTNTYTNIRFSPPLPSGKRALVSRTKPGHYAKVIVSYKTAWWREAGLVGKFTSFKGPICFSWDTSDPGNNQYSLAIFIAGDIAYKWHQLPSLQQEEAVVDHLAELVGRELAENAVNVLEINVMEWTKEEHIWGAPTSAIGPKLLSKHSQELRQPFRDIHFAGGETAFEWKGYLEGAITAGYRAAEEVQQALQPETKL
ncbi:uncharacterized protein N7482_007468 [Penicillium canariense]|uniref:Amine oxidase n=1 Tax=Penicillium canariense TaxID=189055 RepID=A0A9W9HY75_9EURO|nr:uncharacterized protein N7482_007468 [Penicillium canariense]KAJ5160464.1 hypothetical protein N7482_007468 [Penicillium canariense]